MDENMKKFIDFFEHGEYDNHFQLEREVGCVWGKSF
ncbi:hypothetical protein LMOSLCC2540_0378 [Listeria monocytogenes SLCC2540]|nr:hypothetical protein LMOSLCC2540_0378 [Listeria monocytogenes SLCC2540]